MMGLPVIDHLDVWASAVKASSNKKRGRSSGKSKVGFERLKALVLDLAMKRQLTSRHEFQDCIVEDVYSLSTGFAFKSNTYVAVSYTHLTLPTILLV